MNFEKDLDVNQNANTFWVDGIWRVGRRHQLELAFTRLSRIGATTRSRATSPGAARPTTPGSPRPTSTGTDITGGYYRFAAYRNDRFEIGPTIGVGYLSMNAGIQATGTVTGPGGSQSQTLDQSASSGSVTGAVGGYAYGWLTKRLVTRADFLYIKVSPGSKTESVTDWRIGADYYFFRNAGLGVAVQVQQVQRRLSACVKPAGRRSSTFKGFQVFLSFLF